MTPLLVVLALFAWTLPLPVLIQGLIAVVLPVLVGLVTTRDTTAHRRALLLLALSIISAGLTDLLSSLTADRAFDLGLWLFGALLTFVGGTAAHFGFWKPTGIAEAAQNIGTPRRALDADGDGRPDYSDDQEH